MTDASLRLLFVAPELVPLIKTGGLGDVCGALPPTLQQLGADVRVVLPAYRPVLAALSGASRVVPNLRLPGFPACALLESKLANGIDVLAIDCPELYNRDGGPYQDAGGNDWPDNPQRFGLLARVAALLGGAQSPLDWRPDVIHCNDWQSALAPLYLRFAEGARAASVLTVHNLAFQGVFPLATAARLGLPPQSLGVDGVEYHGQMSFLKAGLVYADRITTVSPTYAAEIQHERLGFGMQGLLVARSSVLTGILNGIDAGEWDPAHDPALAARYGAAELERKADNKLALQRSLGLAPEPRIPLLGLVSRFTHQKGIDLLLAIADELIGAPAQLALLGRGDPALEQGVAALAVRHPRRVGFGRRVDEALAHLIEAGADMFLMPSRFEPCGLNQMYSQRYGTPPVVHATGGLADTVVDCSAATLAAGAATGFTFTEESAGALLQAVRRAIAAYHDPATWRALQKNGMAKDFSWARSAREYLAVYREAVNGKS